VSEEWPARELAQVGCQHDQVHVLVAGEAEEDVRCEQARADHCARMDPELVGEGAGFLEALRVQRPSTGDLIGVGRSTRYG